MSPQIPFKVSQTTKDNNNWNNMDTCIIILANITKTVVFLFNFFSPNKLLFHDLDVSLFGFLWKGYDVCMRQHRNAVFVFPEW